MSDSQSNGDYWKMLFEIAQSLISEDTKDGTNNTENQRRKMVDRENKEFLEKAMKHFCAETDPNVKIAKLLRVLRSHENLSDEDVDVIIRIIDDLEEIVEQIDFAYNFCRMGGIDDIIRFMSCESPVIKERVVSLISTVAQNNVKVQNYINSIDLLDMLIEELKVDVEPSAVHCQVLSGISAIVRNNQPSLSKFTTLNGVDVVMQFYRKCQATNYVRGLNKVAVTLVGICRGSDSQGVVVHGCFHALCEIFCTIPLECESRPYMTGYFIEVELNTAHLPANKIYTMKQATEKQITYEACREDRDEGTLSSLHAFLSKLTSSCP